MLFGASIISCTKETSSTNTYYETNNQSATYIINGQIYYDNPSTDIEWSAFLDRMLALAENGYTVYFFRTGVEQTFSKDKVTFTTPSHEEAKNWCEEKEKEGYIVVLTFNQETGEYNCVAYR